MTTVNLQKTDRASAAGAQPVLFYDGECGLCARVVQFALKRDRHRRLHYAPLQGVTYAAVADPKKPVDLDTVVLLDRDGLHVRSEAVVRMFRLMGGVWGFWGLILGLLPRFVRDAGYRFIARRRLAWFGTASTCQLPSRDTQPSFLP